MGTERSQLSIPRVPNATNKKKKKKVQSILTLPRAPARVASTDAPGSTQNVKRGLKDGTRYDRGEKHGEVG